MEQKTASTAQANVSFKKQKQGKEIWRRFRKSKSAMFGLFLFVAVCLLVCAAPLFGSYEEALALNVLEKQQHPSAAHWFGTDNYGRDIFLRIAHGGRYSLLIGLVTSLISAVFGSALGAMAGYFGGKVDDIMMRVLDVFSAIPTIMLALAIISALGSSVPNLIIALSISRIPGFARIVRSSALGIADQEYIEACHAGGATHAHTLMKHVIPNCIGPIIVQTTMNVSLMILQTASMSFLGLGIVPPTPEWGAMISEAKAFIRLYPYMMIFPGIFLVTVAMGISLLGDGLRNALDPKLKN